MNKTKNEKKEVPFKEDLFGKESNQPFLIGNQCQTCGQKYFPPKPFCFDCSGEEMVTIKLGKRGVLYSYATSHVPLIKFASPYTAGWIDLEEGVKVFAPLELEKGIDIEIGMDVELVISELWREEEKIVVGYKYRPVT